MTQKKTFIPFSEIIGQEKAVRFLKRVMALDKVPHAYLFVGIPGIGKTTTAIALTRAMNCLDPLEGDGCGRCPICRQIMGGNFPDIQFLRPEGQFIKIEQVRELNRSFGFKPVTGTCRVSVVCQAERMREEAANSFLKTLEEPPEGNILILNVTEPLDLLPTIVSRCQKIAFQPIPRHLIAKWLMENRGLEDERAMVLARISEGSLGRAIEMCDGDFFERRQEYLMQLIQLPSLTLEGLMETALSYPGKWKKRDPDAQDQGRGGLPEILALWKTWYRDLLLMKVEGPDELLINIDFSRKLKKESKNCTIKNLIKSVLLLEQAQRDFLNSRNLDLLMENTLLTLRDHTRGQGMTARGAL